MTDAEVFQPTTIKPTRGVPIRFKGRLIAGTEWETKNGTWMRFAVYETRGGAYIAVTEGDIPGKRDHIERSATVVEPILDGAGERDETAMQIAVLEQFEWHDRAKALLKGELGWSPYREVA